MRGFLALDLDDRKTLRDDREAQIPGFQDYPTTTKRTPKEKGLAKERYSKRSGCEG